MGEVWSIITGSLVGVIFLIVFILIGVGFLMTRFLRKVEPGKALLIISPFRGIKVSFTGALVFPIIHRMEIMDIATKMITVERNGQDGLICKDNMRADISVKFYLRVNPTRDDVTQVARAIGVERASTTETLDHLFSSKFAEALKTVGKQMEFEELFEERTKFKEEIIRNIGENLNGYNLEDTAIDYLEQTPMDKLDENNVMDAEGIRKITELTLTKKEVVEKRTTETKERILELEKQRIEAETKQIAEISIIKSKEESSALRVSQEERLKAESARITTDEELAVAEVNKERQIEVAAKNKERQIAVETERVERDRALEATERQKLVALADIEKEKVVEQERKNIQDIIRQRVAVERTVAEEEEATKDTRAYAGADRDKQVAITGAEKEAEEKLILSIKEAEAREKAATHLAREKEINAQVELDTSTKIAESKAILAKGIIEETSAPELAVVKVKEADAEAIRKVGEAEADALRFLAEAEAKAIKDKGLAEVDVRNANAEVTERIGKAEAESLRFKFDVEADGITKKSEAMKGYDEVGREHEEFKLKIAMDEKLKLEEISIQKEVAMAKAEVMSTALKSAKIDIVGGDGEFFDKLTNSVADGKAATAYLNNNQLLTELKSALLSGGENGGGAVMAQLKQLIDDFGISSETIKNLSLAAALTRLAGSSEDPGLLDQISKLKGIAEKAGLSDFPISKLLG